MQRSAGILLPISSLPSPYGIGCFSQEAYDFVDWLKEAGQTYWQILPLGVTSYGDSPYQSFSAFAGNPYFISLDALVEEGVLTAAENLLLSKSDDYSCWKTRRTLGICAGDVWYYTVHLGWWKDEVEPFALQWETLSRAAGAKKTAFLLGDFNSEADVRGEGYDLVLRSGWQDTYRLAQERDEGYTVVQAIDGWRDAPDAEAKKRIDQIWCSKAVPVKSSRVVFNGLREPQVSDHAGVLIEL